jgi:hypothetical protein
MKRQHCTPPFRPELETLEGRTLPSALGLLLPSLATPLVKDTSQLQRQHDQVKTDFSRLQSDAANPAHSQQQINDDYASLNKDYSDMQSLHDKTTKDAQTAGSLLFLAALSGSLNSSDALPFFYTLNLIKTNTRQADSLFNSATTSYADQSPGSGEPSLTEYEHGSSGSQP